MPRIRTIKPEFFRHYDLYTAEVESKFPIRVAFSGLWCCADKEGRFKWKPKELKLDVLPHDILDFDEVLNTLLKWQFIIKYEVNGKEYGQIPTFSDHQRITGTEKNNESKLPSPQKGNTLESHNVSKESQNDYKEKFGINMEVQERKGKGKEGKGKDEYIFWESEKKSFLNSGDWIFKFCRDKNVPVEEFDKQAQFFLNDLELKEDFKEVKELKRHFTNWYNLNKNKNGQHISKQSTTIDVLKKL